MAQSVSSDQATQFSGSRRAVLTGVAGAVGVAAAGVVTRALPTQAADGLPVVLGIGNNTGSHATGIVMDHADRDAFSATASGTGNGVDGSALGSGAGVYGLGSNGIGVKGFSPAGIGVYGESTSSNGVSGKSVSNSASGVYGENDAGGYGVAGRSSGGIGSYGETTTGVGIQAQSNGSGRALHVEGRATFKGSGLSSIPVGGKVTTAAPTVAISAGSKILCTLESNQAGLSVERVLKNVAAGTITIILNKAVAAGHTAKAAWFVLG